MGIYGNIYGLSWGSRVSLGVPGGLVWGSAAGPGGFAWGSTGGPPAGLPGGPRAGPRRDYYAFQFVFCLPGGFRLDADRNFERKLRI